MGASVSDARGGHSADHDGRRAFGDDIRRADAGGHAGGDRRRQLADQNGGDTGRQDNGTDVGNGTVGSGTDMHISDSCCWGHKISFPFKRRLSSPVKSFFYRKIFQTHDGIFGSFRRVGGGNEIGGFSPHSEKTNGLRILHIHKSSVGGDDGLGIVERGETLSQSGGGVLGEMNFTKEFRDALAGFDLFGGGAFGAREIVILHHGGGLGVGVCRGFGTDGDRIDHEKSFCSFVCVIGNDLPHTKVQMRSCRVTILLAQEEETKLFEQKLLLETQTEVCLKGRTSIIRKRVKPYEHGI